MLTCQLKIAWRNLLRDKTTTTINLVGLIIGMTASLFVFLWVKNELSYDSYHPAATRIYRIKTYMGLGNGNAWTLETTPYRLGEATKELLPEVELVTRIVGVTPAITIKDKLFQEENAAYVDEHWFDMFHYEFKHGSAAAFNSGIYNVALTESGARNYFGLDDPIGKRIKVDTSHFIVQAVLKDYPSNSSFRHELYLPLAARRANPAIANTDNQWGSFNYRTFVRLTPSASVTSIAANLKQIVDIHRKENNTTFGLTSLADMHFEDDLLSSSVRLGNWKTVQAFSLMGALILVIACINYVNLTTARALRRSKEVSIKKIVGADKTSLFFQFVLESLVLVGLAVLVTILLISALMPAFNALTENQFRVPLWSIELWRLIGSTVGVVLLLVSIYPALLLSSFRPLAAFRGFGVRTVKGNVLRQALVVMQFAASVVLIISTMVIYYQMCFITSENESYDKFQVLSFVVPFKALSHVDNEGRRIRLNELKQALKHESSVSNVAVLNGSVVNMQNYSSGAADWNGRPSDFNPTIVFFEADEGFRQILNLELIEGRWFFPGSKADSEHVILNETAVKQLGLLEPIVGQRFVSRGDSGVVVGVVKDFYYKSLREKIDPVVIKPLQNGSFHFLVETAPGRTIEAQRGVERVWKSNFPDIPFNYSFLDDDFDRLYKEERRSTTLLLLFALLALVVSALGLFGLAAFRAESRTKEVGIRKVLGATVSNLVRLLSIEFVKLVLIAVLIASPIAWWAMNSWLAGFAYRIEIRWWIFAASGMVAVIVALITVSFQAIRAAMANPVTSLRNE